MFEFDDIPLEYPPEKAALIMRKILRSRKVSERVSDKIVETELLARRKRQSRRNSPDEVKVLLYDSWDGMVYFQAGKRVKKMPLKDFSPAEQKKILESVKRPSTIPSDNPRKTQIYSDIIEIKASKAGMPHRCDSACRQADHRYVHRFKPGSPIYGLPGGKILIGK